MTTDRQQNVGAPKAQGLYDPAFEHDSCGVGFVVDMKGRKSHDIIQGAIEICENLELFHGCFIENELFS